jgi:hypothetical protein
MVDTLLPKDGSGVWSSRRTRFEPPMTTALSGVHLVDALLPKDRSVAAGHHGDSGSSHP